MNGRERAQSGELFHFEVQALKAGIRTRAGRAYPIDVLKRAVEDMNETVLFLFSYVDTQNPITAFSFSHVIGQLSMGWVDDGGVLWVKGFIFNDSQPLKAVPNIQRKEFLEQFYVCPVSAGITDEHSGVVQSTRFDGFVTSVGPSWDGAERLKILLTEVRGATTGA